MSLRTVLPCQIAYSSNMYCIPVTTTNGDKSLCRVRIVDTQDEKCIPVTTADGDKVLVKPVSTTFVITLASYSTQYYQAATSSLFDSDISYYRKLDNSTSCRYGLICPRSYEETIDIFDGGLTFLKHSTSSTFYSNHIVAEERYFTSSMNDVILQVMKNLFNQLKNNSSFGPWFTDETPRSLLVWRDDSALYSGYSIDSNFYSIDYTQLKNDFTSWFVSTYPDIKLIYSDLLTATHWINQCNYLISLYS